MATQQELSVRREIEEKLFRYGLTQADVANALDIDTSSVANDLNKIGKVQVMFETTNLTHSERRDKTFTFTFCKYIELIQQKTSTDDVDRGILKALEVYLDAKRIRSVIEGVISTIETMTNPVDPLQYRPYRLLLTAIFGEKKTEISEKRFLVDHYSDHCVVPLFVTRESLPAHFSNWAMSYYNDLVRMPLDQPVKIVADEVISTLPNERTQEIIRLRFGLLDGRPLTLNEIGIRYSLTSGRIQQIEARALRQLRHPERARRLRIFLQSPFSFSKQKLEEMFTPPPPPVPPVIYEELGVANVDKLLAKSVEELDLSVRSYSALKNNNIETIADLVQKTEGYLKLKNFGRRSLNEIRELLESMGLCFGMKIENGILKRPTVETVQE